MTEENRVRYARECDCQKASFVYPKPLCACEKSLAPAEAPAPEVGPWIGWMGSTRPFHPYTVIEAVRLDHPTAKASYYKGYANGVNWNSHDIYGDPVVAYRIVKEHREPREFWAVNTLGQGWVEVEPPVNMKVSKAVKFREVDPFNAFEVGNE